MFDVIEHPIQQTIHKVSSFDFKRVNSSCLTSVEKSKSVWASFCDI